VAARLEEFGEPEQINISKQTYALVKDKFDCIYQGKKEVHNKGLVDMYFVEGRK
jgi:adenylate cyclase